MHANFVLKLFPPPVLSDEEHSIRRCCQSCNLCLRRTFRRFCLALILLLWLISFTTTIPLLYTIDSNEKLPKSVHCPGTKEITYLEEWFDQNRLTQMILFNLIPFLISLFLSLIVLLKLFYDCFIYLYSRSTCRMETFFKFNSSIL